MAFTATTPNSAAAWRPDLYSFAPETVIPSALIFSITTVSGQIEGDAPSLRVAYADDATAEFIDEAAEIDEAQPDLAEALVYTKKIALLIRMSREQYTQNGTDEHLSNSVARSMVYKADNALLAQPAPTSPAVAPATGLCNTSGLVTQSGVADDLDALVDLEATVRANRGFPTVWVLAPDTWAALRKLKIGSSYNSTLLGAGTDDAEPRLLSIPVLVNPEAPSMTGLLIDPRAIVSAVSPLMVATSADMYFNSDSIGVRALMRTGHAVVRPDRVGIFALPSTWTVTLGSPSSGNFTLTYNGATTANIGYTATAASVKSALAALNDAWSASDWTVTGSNGGPYTVTSPGGTLTGNGAGLTGATFSVVAA
ncbi:phage major capsid protein [Mycobacterium conspicuum]|jgi:hypothetical protein|uniref:Phage capsid-like C-terminal domain-containing protein n=1 Tax=Mycobacterium conspicuum TaxID=44010 RepID=A0A1X1SZB9_9MYCO|nr:phage major capsid protein [Mycobacterium conspicuum]ORV37257.1 major capsid protein [Mycobacterium conspicuum]BBZ38733.1 hypothetical protein MCNS_17960 [Mycobacterium conspicuum]